MNPLCSLFALAACALTVQAQTTVYEQKFGTSADFATMTVLDANDDGITWQYDDRNACAKISFNNDSEQDDWLLAPLQLEAGHLYTLSFAVTGGGTWARESYSASISKPLAADHDVLTSEDMTTELWPRTTMVDAEKKGVKTMQYYATQSGTYYYGIHCTSDVGQSTFRVDDILVQQVAGTTPAAPSLTVEAGAQGALWATLRATAPTTTIDGEPLTELTQMTFYRDNVVLKVIESPTPGETYTQPDMVPYARMNEYKVVATNASGDGDAAVLNQWLGVDTPGAIRNLNVREDPDSVGVLVLSWEAPEMGSHGGYQDPASLCYWVSAGSDDDVCVGSETTWRYDLHTTTQQTSCTFALWASNSAGTTKELSRIITGIGGPALVAPLTESFHHTLGPWMNEMTLGSLGDAHWFNQTSNRFGGSQDGDGYCFVFSSEFADRCCRVKSPKIDIRSLTHPRITFFYYQTSAPDTLLVQVNPEFSTWTTLDTIVVQGSSPGWTWAEVSLEGCEQYRFVQIGFEGRNVTVGQEAIAIDQVSVRSRLDHDMEVVSLTVPDKAVVDQEATFSVTLRNNGTQAVEPDDCTVLLLKNGEAVASYESLRLAPGAMLSIRLTDTPTLADGRTAIYAARVMMPTDEYADNDRCEGIAVTVQQPDYPCPESLAAASLSDTEIAVTWHFDASQGIPGDAVTDTFEDYDAFTITSFGDWAQYDADGQRTIRMAMAIGSQTQLLDYTNAGYPMAFQVFDPTEAGIPYAAWDPHSGDQYMAAFRNSTNADDQTVHANDDWLISPLVCPRRQTVSFFAKATMGAYVPERLEVWATPWVYVTKEDDMQHFTLLTAFDISNVSAWKEYIFTLPADMAHFAFRYCSQGQYALLLDDVTYVPYDAPLPEVTFEGYNIYRDDEQIGFTNQPRFIDDCAVVGQEYRYNVTAVFTIDDHTCESAYSLPVLVRHDPTGVEGNSSSSSSLKNSSSSSFDGLRNRSSRYDLLGRELPTAPSGIYIHDNHKILKTQ